MAKAADSDPRAALRAGIVAAGGGGLAPADLERRIERLARLGVTAARRGEPGYPEALAGLADPPNAVFVRGTLGEHARAVAIVGARAASDDGRRHAFDLAADLARLGYVVVSGLARGIDAAAHRGALENGGRTVAVLPGGLDEVTPRHHRELAESIAASGAWVSERAPGSPVFRSSFIERNRLIAALAAATVVVEAAERSGALSTAAAARRIGRPVLAMPGDVDRPGARGCHQLLRSGARVCTGAADVLAAIAPAARARPVRGRRAPAVTPVRPTTHSAGPSGDPDTVAVLGALASRPRGVESIAVTAGVGVARTLAVLLQLEWSGLVTAHPGQRWSRSAERAR